MKYWIGVASAEHVRKGCANGFMQLCHAKLSPLKRLKHGDIIIYYAPTEKFRTIPSLPYQAFTAIGIVKNTDPYKIDMENGFCGFRRDVEWWPAQETGIKNLLSTLEFTKDKKNWGYQLRFGLFEISQHDAHLIATSMQANLFA